LREREVGGPVDLARTASKPSRNFYQGFSWKLRIFPSFSLVVLFVFKSLQDVQAYFRFFFFSLAGRSKRASDERGRWAPEIGLACSLA
jgi:hypothetical protein